MESETDTKAKTLAELLREISEEATEVSCLLNTESITIIYFEDLERRITVRNSPPETVDEFEARAIIQVALQESCRKRGWRCGIASFPREWRATITSWKGHDDAIIDVSADDPATALAKAFLKALKS